MLRYVQDNRPSHHNDVINDVRSAGGLGMINVVRNAGGLGGNYPKPAGARGW